MIARINCFAVQYRCPKKDSYSFEERSYMPSLTISVTINLNGPLADWASSLKEVTPEQAILELLRQHAGVVSQLEQAFTRFKQSLPKFPAGIEFEVSQVIGSSTWNTYDHATKLSLGKRISKEANALGLQYVRKTSANHAIYQRLPASTSASEVQ